MVRGTECMYRSPSGGGAGVSMPWRAAPGTFLCCRMAWWGCCHLGLGFGRGAALGATFGHSEFRTGWEGDGRPLVQWGVWGMLGERDGLPDGSGQPPY